MSTDKIKEAALQLFSAKGYEATTMREIGKKAGIKGPSIYAHFKCKEELFLTILEDIHEKLKWEHRHNIAGIISQEEKNIKELLLKVFTTYYNFFSNHKLELFFWRRAQYFPPASLAGRYDINRFFYMKPILEVYLEFFAKAKKTKQLKNFDTNLLVMSFFAFTTGHIDSLLITPVILTDRQLIMVFEIYWQGIKYSG